MLSLSRAGPTEYLVSSDFLKFKTKLKMGLRNRQKSTRIFILDFWFWTALPRRELINGYYCSAKQVRKKFRELAGITEPQKILTWERAKQNDCKNRTFFSFLGQIFLHAQFRPNNFFISDYGVIVIVKIKFMKQSHFPRRKISKPSKI